jgi:choline dehydrogenase
MGDPADPGTVVDAALNVAGTTGLSVADSSILPVIPRANTNLTAMMIGHRAAQFLRTTDRAPARSE